MEKKYRYSVELSAEEGLYGTVDLTEMEARIVAYATSPTNWNDVDGGGYCGSFYIDIEHPQEIVTE